MRIRTITLLVWLLFPVYILAIPKMIVVTGLQDWGGIFFLSYLVLCFATAYRLQKSKCPACDGYMFREGKMKYALQKFLFRQCGQCGYRLSRCEQGRGDVL